DWAGRTAMVPAFPPRRVHRRFGCSRIAMPGPFQIVSNHPSMRVATLLLCLTVAACQTAGDKPAAELAAPAAPASAANPSTVAVPPAARSSGSGGGARGGATTAAARGGGEPVEVAADPLTQARADCWMKVERD